MFRNSVAPLPSPWEGIFGPLRSGAADGLVVVGQIGQSLDGRIATPTGHSHYINGPAGLAHLHRLRALVDAVVVGVGHCDRRRSATHGSARRRPQPGAGGDRPQRPAAGQRQAARRGWRPPPDRDRSRTRRCLPASKSSRCRKRTDGIEPAAILAALAERGLRRILIEGGADTVSRFLAARCLDRLHVVVAPIILGSGPLRPRAAADRAGRSGVARAGPHPPARRRSAVRLRSVGSAHAGRPREEVDVTDPDRRAAARNKFAAARQPADHLGRAAHRRSRARRRPSPTGSSFWISRSPGWKTQSDAPCTTA